MTFAALADAVGRDVSRETVEKLERLQAMVVAEASQQNLVSAATLDDFWLRHIVDSAQLLRHGDDTPWLDLGTGAGFPGLVIAILAKGPVVLCEERRLRYTFLQTLADALALDHVRVCGMKLERLESFPAATISARAFAPLERLLTLAHRFSTEKTRWVLPKGRNAQQEVESVRHTWHGDFRLEPSVTDPDSHIIVAQGIRPRTSR
jgi:16S rRNA (guanine527-N7)-methyltransferase